MNSKLLMLIGVLVMLVVGTLPLAATVQAAGTIRGDVDIAGKITDVIPYGTTTLLKVDVGGMHPFGVWTNNDTEIDGMLTVGAEVRIKAEFLDNKLVADEVRVGDVDGFDIRGDVEIDGTIAKVVTRDGKTCVKVSVGGPHPIRVLVNEDTDIEGTLVEGAMVSINAEFLYGKLVAQEIEVRG